jgi:phosphoglycerol transferase
LRSFSNSLGFLLLTFWILLLFYIPTGLGSVFSYFITYVIRGWGRLFPILILLSMCIFLIIVTSTLRRFPLIKNYVLAGIFLIFFFDQLSGNYKYDLTLGNFAKTQAITAVEDINRYVPKGCGILQFPVVPFPEVPPIYRMQDYDHLWLYLFSKDYKFSYGAVKNTSSYLFQSENFDLSDRSKLITSGFCYLVLDTFSFESPSQIQEFEKEYRLIPVPMQKQERWTLYNLK